MNTRTQPTIPNILLPSVLIAPFDNQLWTQDSPGVLGSAAPGDAFGQSLASGDFNGDSKDDLAVGVPGEDVNSIISSGAVNVLYGSNNGLTATGDQVWHQDSADILE